MNKDRLFRALGEQKRETLLELLNSAYDLMNHDDRRSIFGKYVDIHSLAGEVYATACRLANDAQREKLDAEIRRFNIRVEPRR